MSPIIWALYYKYIILTPQKIGDLGYVKYIQTISCMDEKDCNLFFAIVKNKI